MIKKNSRKVFILVCGSVVLLVASMASAANYRPGNGITDAAIKKQYDIQWFHVSESCKLRAKGHDRDEKCGAETDYQWVDAGDDYIDLGETQWTGTGLIGTGTGSEKTWQNTTPTGASGVTITAKIYDKTADPHIDANDSGYATATKQMYAYEAVAKMNMTHSKTADVDGKTLYETVATAGETTELDLSHDQIKAILTDVSTGTDDDDASEWATATWKLTTNPATATLDSLGDLKSTIGADTSGTFYASVYDRDNTESGPDSVTVSLSGGEGVSAGVAFTYDIEDNCGAVSGLGFAFSSDHIGDDDVDKLTMNSNEDCTNNCFDPIDRWATDEETYGYDSEVVWKGAKDDTSLAKAIIGMQVECEHTGAASPEDDSQARARIEGSVTWEVGVPGYDSPINNETHHIQPEDGYND